MKRFPDHHRREVRWNGWSCPSGPGVVSPGRQRRGAVILVVLIVVTLLSLGAYSFSELMLIEYEATSLTMRGSQARMFADSGIEMAATLVANRSDPSTDNLYHDPAQFSIVMQDSEQPRGRGRFSIVVPVENDPTFSRIRFGLMNESARINLLFAASQEDLELGRDMLMVIPGMTEDLADALLDWVDEDEEPRDYGCESEYYVGLNPPVTMPYPGQPLHSLDELLPVRGMSAALLFGEDANRNGLLDSNENDGENPPFDNADDYLDLGFSAYLTIHSRETNRRLDGSERIYLNQTDLQGMYDELVEAYDEDSARFIVAWLAFGPSNDDTILSDTEAASADAGLSADESAQMAQFAQGVATALFAASAGENTVTANGLDLSGGKQYTLRSVFDLVDAEVEATIDGTSQTLKSPWTSDPAAMQGYLPDLLDTLTVSDQETIRGRIDINQARYDVLLSIPGIDEQLASAISGSSMIGPNGEPMSDQLLSRATVGWLLMEGLTDLTTLRELAPYITTRGDVYSGQVIGHFDAGGPQVRMDVTVDASEYPARILFCRDLSYLGPAYPPELLVPVSGQ